MKEAERRSLTPLQMRQRAAQFALTTVDAQREQFKRCEVAGREEEAGTFGRHSARTVQCKGGFIWSRQGMLKFLCPAGPCPGCRYGVWADWDTPYVTLQPAYEAAQLRVFGQMVLNGHIYRCAGVGVGGVSCA